MREILFRGKNKVTNEFIIGSKTNIQRIREMNDSELADFLYNLQLGTEYDWHGFCDVCELEKCISSCMTGWLNKESDEYGGIDWK